jgi:hypothetical protein
MKKLQPIIAGLLIIITLLISHFNREAEWNHGKCKCGEAMFQECGTVFPFTQYKCPECGYKVLH